jgi:Protein of unknown function (DUF5132)
MALWDDMTEILVGSWTGNIVLGAAALLVAPVVVPAVLTVVWPVVKLSIQGGVLVYDKTAEMITEMGEQMSDLVAEARAERTGTPAA